MKIGPRLPMTTASYVRIFPESRALLTFLFHSLFRSEAEIRAGLVNAQQRMTVAHLRQFIEYFLGCGYCFVSPEDILRGLDKTKKYALITFDDGYYNNHRMIPLLQEYKVSALFFISTANIRDNKSFWWDSIYREALKRNKSLSWIRKEEKRLKTMTAGEIDRSLRRQFGDKIFKPVSDIDRPFTPSELKDFSSHSRVFLGNHTSDHAILTNCNEEEARAQILGCQQYLADLTGKTPATISFPNGNYNKKIVSLAAELGLRVGITVEPRKNRLPLSLQGNEFVNLGRFMLKGNDKLLRQMEIVRSDFSVRNTIKQLMRKNY